MRKFEKFIANRSFYKHVLTLAIPLMLQQLITSSVNLVDNLMIGQLGDAALGGVASSNRFFMIGLFSVMGILAAAAVFIAQYYGAKDQHNMKEAFRFSILSAGLITILFFIIAFFFPQHVLRFFTDDPSILVEGGKYIKLASISLLPFAISMSMASAMRAVGQTKIPLYIGIFAVFTNAVFNYVLIFGHFGFPQLGIVGAALATIISRFVELTLLLIVMKRKEFDFTTKIKDIFKVSTKNIKKISLKALPLMSNELLWSFGMASLFKFYATRGKEVIAGMSIASTTADIFFVLFAGMSVATMIVVSQPLGANNLEEAKRNGYHMIGFSTILAMIFGIVMFGSSFVVPLFYNVSEASQHVAANILRIQSFMFWIYMGTAQCYFILRAGGDMRSTLVMDAGFMWTVNIPVVALFTYFTGINIFLLFIIGQLTDFVKLTLAYQLIRKEKWLTNLTIAEMTSI